MADISKCFVGDKCAQKDRCYRHTAVDSPYRQSYMMPNVSAEGCQSFWANEGYTNATNDGSNESTTG